MSFLPRGMAFGLVLGALGLTIGACDGDPDLSDPEEAGEALGEAFCGYLAGCCGESVVPGGSEAACIEQITANFPALIEQAESDGYQYDGRCVEAQIAVFSGADCSLAGVNGVPAAGTCVPYCPGGFVHGTAKEGEPCDDPRACDFGLVCNGTVCTDPCGAQAGEACGQVGESTYAYCRAGTVCQPDETNPATGTCVTLPGRGEPCPNYACAPGLACVDGTCDDPQPNGSPCNTPTACSSNYCDTTDPTAPVCGPAPGPGEPCTYQCSPDARCDGTTCVALPGLGQPCPDYQCAEGLFCSDDVCQRLEDQLCSVFERD